VFLLATLLLTAGFTPAEPPKAPPVVHRHVHADEPCKAPPVVRKAESQPTYKAGHWSTRPPVGDHTHTCPNPTCRLTWDHAINSGHNCMRCGAEQKHHDPFPKPVHIWNPAPVQPQPVIRPVFIPSYTLPGGFGDNCGPSG
jgi:hypothetical protein